VQNVRFRGGLVFKAHGLRESLNSRLVSNKEDSSDTCGCRTYMDLEVDEDRGDAGGKLSFSIALICTINRRIPASASKNQGPFDPALRAGVQNVHNVRFRGGLVFEAHRLRGSLNSRRVSNKEDSSDICGCRTYMDLEVDEDRG